MWVDVRRLVRQKWDPMSSNLSCLSLHPIPFDGTGSTGFGMITAIITITTGFRGASG